MKLLLSVAIVSCVCSSALAQPFPGIAQAPASQGPIANATPASLSQSGFGAVAGKTFYALDGSSFTLTFVEGGFERHIVSSDGMTHRAAFTFLSPKLGSISDGQVGNIVGMFRLTDQGIASEYADGHRETMLTNDGGGVTLSISDGLSNASCFAWYPQGHVFSLEERKAALAAFANRLGLGDAPKSTSSCPGEATNAPTDDKPAAAPSRHAEKLPKLMLLPRPDQAPVAVAQTPVPVSFSPQQANGGHIIEVRDSLVHPIDPPLPPPSSMIAGGQSMAAMSPPSAANASSCLKIETNGQHWGFHNQCGYDVQFAYCLMTGGGLAACNKGGVTGSVAANGTSALVSDKSISETNGDHDFRWVACAGGAGEVAAHLDHADPPQGRCERPDPS